MKTTQVENFSSGAKRDSQDGKGRYDLLPLKAIDRLAKRLEEGAKHYGAHNWRHGIPTSRLLSSAFRHLAQAADGRDDEDHLAAVLFNVSALMETIEAVDRGLLPPDIHDLKDNPWYGPDNDTFDRLASVGEERAAGTERSGEGSDGVEGVSHAERSGSAHCISWDMLRQYCKTMAERADGDKQRQVGKDPYIAADPLPGGGRGY